MRFEFADGISANSLGPRRHLGGKPPQTGFRTFQELEGELRLSAETGMPIFEVLKWLKKQGLNQREMDRAVDFYLGCRAGKEC
ncbi:MAG: hypothetical protein ACYCOU_03880 [Sulfobacillus sp.]